jgi:preprotein translocase subunit SecE
MKIANPAQRAKGMLNFFREVKVEGKRVNWPTREKTIKDTIVVIVFAVIVAAFLSTFDYVFQILLNRFFI